MSSSSDQTYMSCDQYNAYEMKFRQRGNRGSMPTMYSTLSSSVFL